MGQRHRKTHQKPKGRGGAQSSAAIRQPIVPAERKPPVVYGAPFIVLEDADHKTFVFKAGKWVEHTATITECRVDCQVKELPQKINGMTRYEVCQPV